MRGNLLYIILTFLGISHAYHGDSAWVQKASFGGDARHRCTGFSVGNKGYIGGGHINSGVSVYHKDYWQYDPATDSWTQIADFGGGYRYHSTAFTIGNVGYVGLGENNSNEYFNDFWKYIPLINTWVQIAPFPGNPRRGASSFVLDEYGYVGTGQSDFGYETDFYRYNPDLNTWSPIAEFAGEARSSAVGFSLNNKGYVSTGHILGDDINDCWEYDPLLDVWSQKADVGPIPRQDATGFVVQGEAYIGTGNDAEGNFNFNDFWKYIPETDQWVEIAEFDGQGRRYMVSFVIGDVAFCGTGTNGTNMRDFWAFYPLLSNEISNTLSKYKVYPNPTNSYLYLDPVFEGKYISVILSDLKGKIHMHKDTEMNQPLDLNELEKGTYLLQIFSDNQLIYTEKIILN